MKIQKVIIKDFKKIKNLEKEINGKNIILLGDNDVGKSSFIQAIEIALGMTEKIPLNSNSEIEIQAGDSKEKYIFKTIVTDGKPKFEVIAPNGMKDRTKSVLCDIVGSIDFDIDKFVELSNSKAGKKQQIEIVKSFLNEETKQSLKEIELDIAYNYEERTALNSRIKELNNFIKEIDILNSDIDQYSLPIDVKEVNQKLQESIEKNNEINLVNERTGSRTELIKENSKEIKELEKKILSLKNHSKQLNDKNKQAAEWLIDNKKIDVSEFEQQIQTASDHNEKYNKVQDLLKKQALLKELNEENKEHNDAIEHNRQLYADTVRDCNLPVDGLSFNEDTLLFNDFPVDSNTLSTSEIMYLGIQLKMAKTPNVKSILLENGQNLGSAKLKAIQEMCRKYDYQIIMEEIERGTEELKIEIMPIIQ